jgi:hypothetical protein
MPDYEQYVKNSARPWLPYVKYAALVVGAVICAGLVYLALSK